MPEVKDFPELICDVSAVITSGTDSGVVDLRGCSQIGWLFPNMAGTSITFLVEMADGETYTEAVYDDGTTVSITVPDAGGPVMLEDPSKLLMLKRFKIKSNQSETDKTIVIKARPL